jgi:4-amino-4-deoxy-L-arabinose transferase-like glycosyltransferase
MRFDLDHDWQGSISTPRAKMGERAKTQLLIVLCGIWLVFGLLGHSPWKPLESQSVSIIKSIVEDGHWLNPLSATQLHTETPPLYYQVAATFAKVTSPFLKLHDAARLTTGFWMLATLILVGLTGREMWGKGFGRQTVFVFIGSLGLILSAHTITPNVSNLTGIAFCFYAFSLLSRQPYRAAILLGVGIAVSFLSSGILPVIIILTTPFFLTLFFSKQWPLKRILTVVLLALLVASPAVLAWLMLMHLEQPYQLYSWWLFQLYQFGLNQHKFIFILETIFWYCWPATPLALWGVWRYRHQLFNTPRFQLIFVFFTVAYVCIAMSAYSKEIATAPLLIPLTLLAGGSIETLRRGAAAALNWFGLMLYGLIIGAVWLGWIAMQTGAPHKLKERLVFLSGISDINTPLILILIAVFVSLIWLLAILRSQHSNRSAATNWAIGLTTIWTLLMTLWLPMIESARSYELPFTQLKQSLPSAFICANSHHVGNAQRDLLYYYTNIKTEPISSNAHVTCDLLLIQDDRKSTNPEPGSDWALIWQGKRKSERRESFRLYHKKI